MKAYTIHKFYECSLTGSVLVEVTFALHEGLRTFLHPFSSKENATSYLEREKCDWFLGAIEAYVIHKKHIIESGNHKEQINSLNVCLQAIDAYHKKSTQNGCEGFLRGFKYFQDILPNQNNPSFNSSVEALNELKAFCENEIKLKK